MTMQYYLVYTYKGVVLFSVLTVLFSIFMYLFSKALYRGTQVKAERSKIGTYMWLVASFFGWLSMMLGYSGQYDRSMLVYEACLILLTSGALYNTIIGKKYSLQIALQSFLIVLIILIWYVSAMQSVVTVKEYPSLILFGIITISTNLLFWIINIWIYRSHFQNKFRPEALKQYTGIVVIMILFILLSIDTIWTVPMWDSTDYLQAIIDAGRWEFTLGTIDNFDLCFHKSLGYAFFMTLGEWLFKPSTLGIHIIQLLLSVITIGVFGGIVGKLLPKASQMEKNLYVAVFAYSPYILGFVGTINVDYAMVIFLVWMLYCYYNHLGILEIICALLLCFTKETAVFIYAGFVIGVYIARFIKCDMKMPQRLILCMKCREYFRYALPAITWLISFIASRLKPQEDEISAWGASGSYIGWQGVIRDISVQYNTFGFSTVYIIAQIKQFFINYIWLLILVTIIIMIIGMATRKRKESKNDLIPILIPLFTMILTFLIITFIYITHNHYRYKIAIFPVLYLICFILINSYCDRKSVCKIIMGLIATLFLVQSFYNIDPITYLAGKNVNIGNAQLVNFNIGIGGNSTLTEYTVYNRQGISLGRVLEKAFTQIDCDESTLIVLPHMNTEAEYEIFGVSGLEYRQGVYWDRDQHIINTIEEEGKIKVSIAELQPDGRVMQFVDQQLTEVNMDNYSRIFYFDFPFSDSYDKIDKSGTIVNVPDTVIENHGWIMKVFLIK